MTTRMPVPPRRGPHGKPHGEPRGDWPRKRRGFLPVLAEWMGHSYQPRGGSRQAPLWVLLAGGLFLGGAAMMGRGWLSHPDAPAVTAKPATSMTAALPAPPMPFSMPVRVAIPAVGVTARVISLGENRNGTVAVPAPKTPMLTSWFDAGPAPGQDGPAAIFGYVDTAAGPAVFYRLGDLVPGDVVRVARADGRTASFVIYRIAKYRDSTFPAIAAYGDTVGPELRLITCGGDVSPVTGSHRGNIVAYARLLPHRS